MTNVTLFSNTTGSQNTASGASSLSSNTTGNYNNQSFVGSERPTMKLLLNGSFGSFFNTMGLS